MTDYCNILKVARGRKNKNLSTVQESLSSQLQAEADSPEVHIIS